MPGAPLTIEAQESSTRPVFVVRVEQDSRSSSTDPRQLPSQVGGVLHAGRDSLSASRAVNVCGIAGQENATVMHAVDHSAVDPKVREPERLADDPCVDSGRPFRYETPDGYRAGSPVAHDFLAESPRRRDTTCRLRVAAAQPGYRLDKARRGFLCEVAFLPSAHRP
jgi:hypothetical protein